MPYDKSSFNLVDRVFCTIDEKVSAGSVNSLTAEQAVIYHVWGALGILENGSFQYFFENGIDAGATAASFERLGLSDAAECFRLARSLLPSEYWGADWSRQLQMLQQRETSLDTLAQRVIADSKRIESRLAGYIMADADLKTLLRE